MEGNIFLWPFNQSLIKHNLTLVTPNPLPSSFCFPRFHRFSDPQFPLRRVNRPLSIYFVNVFFSKQASFLLPLPSPLPSTLPHFLEGASAPSFDRVSAIFFPFRFSKELQASTYSPPSLTFSHPSTTSPPFIKPPPSYLRLSLFLFSFSYCSLPFTGPEFFSFSFLRPVRLPRNDDLRGCGTAAGFENVENPAGISGRFVSTPARRVVFLVR